MIGDYLTALLGASLAVFYMAIVHRWLARESALAEPPASRTSATPDATSAP